ncbi:sulfatase-like hydrolase/transferase [Echinicola sediminis]
MEEMVTWMMKKLAILACCLLTLNVFGWQQKDPGTPNIVLIMADDLGYETLEVNGSNSYQTPHLDRLAKEGMNFTHCYSTPLCTPSRVQLMTGKYNFRNYIGFGLLDPQEKTFGDYLQQAGYKTMIAGKWQLFGNQKQQELAGGKIGTLPQDAGFDEYCLWQVEDLGSRYKDPLLSTSEETKVYEDAFGPDVFVDEIGDFMERHSDQPFFVYYPMVLTHDPFVPTPANKDFGGFEASSKVNDPAYFGEMVSYMDKLVGEIVQKIEDLGISENTLILFIGDNGTDHDVVSLQEGQEIRGDKGQTTEAGTHVPMIARWKGQIPEGTVNDNLVDFTDFLPTLLDAVSFRERKGVFTDGLSFYPQLLGKSSKGRKWVFCHYDPNWGKFEKKRFVHDREWKLYDSGEIYHIAKDPLEEFPVSETSLNRSAQRKITSFQKVLRDYQ